MTLITRSNTVGLVLAGGAGSRMQGQDKGLQTYRGKRLIDHVVEKLVPQVGRLMISANRHLTTYTDVAETVVRDSITGNRRHSKRYQGPMAGIAAAAEHLIQEKASKKDLGDFQAIQISSCDTPMIPLDLCSRLTIPLNSNQSLVAVVHDGERRQSLHCLIAQPAWVSLVKSYEQGERAMYRWQNAIGVVEVDFSDQPYGFKNFNTLNSLAGE